MSGRSQRRAARRGFTLIELLVVMAIIATLLTVAVPRYFKSLERSKETVLRQDLTAMREAIDRHKADVGTYPESLVELVEKGYLRRLPEDPFTKSSATWTVTTTDDPETTGIGDVHSGAEGVSESGVPFGEF